MSTSPSFDPREAIRALLQVRQIREFTPEPPTEAELDAIVDAGRWSGSSTNSQPWRFITIRDRVALDRLHEAGLPQTRSLKTAPAAIAIALPDDEYAISHAYDEGRAAERLLIAAQAVGLRGGIAWITTKVRPVAAEVLHLPAGWFVRTIVVVGHPTDAALAPKGQGRLPREETVFTEQWSAADGPAPG